MAVEPAGVRAVEVLASALRTRGPREAPPRFGPFLAFLRRATESY